MNKLFKLSSMVFVFIIAGCQAMPEHYAAASTRPSTSDAGRSAGAAADAHLTLDDRVLLYLGIPISAP